MNSQVQPVAAPQNYLSTAGTGLLDKLTQGRTHEKARHNLNNG